MLSDDIEGLAVYLLKVEAHSVLNTVKYVPIVVLGEKRFNNFVASIQGTFFYRK